jgi:hypothetical protein
VIYRNVSHLVDPDHADGDTEKVSCYHQEYYCF